MAESNNDSPGGESDRSFLTEVPRPVSTVNGQRRSTAPANVGAKDDSDIRGVEQTNATPTPESDMVRFIDRFREKQQHSQHIRAMIQKAAQKTILVVRTKNATQAAENVTIRFNRDTATELPRSVVLHDVSQRVLAHMTFASNRKRRLLLELFDDAVQVDALLKDMFWYLTAHCFQPGQHKDLEANFKQRIADNFTSLFLHAQVQSTNRDSGVLDMLPDVLAQMLFMALYEGFPKSRKNMITKEVRKDILRVCYCWVLGFVPADLDWSHWMSVDQESPKRIAALADFPAMRNRMLRAERIERTKMEVQIQHESVLDETENCGERDDALDDGRLVDERHKLPVVCSGHQSHVHGTNGSRVETHERCVYQMKNSPLIDTFLTSHQLETNASHLKVQLRLTNGKHFDLSSQESLHATTLPRARRRRLVNPKSYAEVLEKIKGSGDSVRTAYASEKKKMHNQDVTERRSLVLEQRELEAQFSALRQHGTKMHEFSNLIASKARIETLAPAKNVAKVPLKDSIKSSPCSGPPNLIPRPPPPRL